MLQGERNVKLWQYARFPNLLTVFHIYMHQKKRYTHNNKDKNQVEKRKKFVNNVGISPAKASRES